MLFEFFVLLVWLNFQKLKSDLLDKIKKKTNITTNITLLSLITGFVSGRE